ncbi:hypothetical protein E2C01_046595 [Portunus trituberculatus]|uniref:Uncharacterized protein n=1 Tax=Portunus trituberculatus TaxID=210409 RepID=A0A5B7G582_PORTR|nr:hypothetical protein [Portunus trituberculatus]
MSAQDKSVGQMEEEEELLKLSLALNNKRKRNWVYPANMKQLECELEMDFRLTPAQFYEVLSFNEQDIKKQGTNYRTSINSQ